MDKVMFWEFEDKKEERVGDLASDLPVWIQDCFNTEMFERAILLCSISDLGVPFKQTKAYKLLDSKMIAAVNNDSEDLVEIEVNKNGVLSILINADCLKMIYENNWTDYMFYHGVDLKLVFIVNTDFYINYSSWIDNLDEELSWKIKYIAVDVGKDVEGFKNLDLIYQFSHSEYNILSDKIIELMEDKYSEDLVLTYNNMCIYTLRDSLVWFNQRFSARNLVTNLNNSSKKDSLLSFMKISLDFIAANRQIFYPFEHTTIHMYHDGTRIRNILYTNEWIEQRVKLLERLQINLILHIDVSKYTKSVRALQVALKDTLVVKDIGLGEE